MSIESRLEKLESMAMKLLEARKLGSGAGQSDSTIDTYKQWNIDALDLLEQFVPADPLTKEFKRNGRSWISNYDYIDKNFSDQYPIYKVLVRKIRSQSTSQPEKDPTVKQDKKASGTLVFISHASKDKQIAQYFMDDLLIGCLGFKAGEIFCSTTDGTRIKSGHDWRDSIQLALQEAKVTILLITPHYKESEVCQNEMGAAWVAEGLVIPLIAEPVTYATVGVIQEPNQIEKLGDGPSLDRMKDQLETVLEIPHGQVKTDRWSQKRGEFLIKLQGHIKKNPFPTAFTRDEFDRIGGELEAAKRALSEKIELTTKLNAIVEDFKLTKDAEQVQEVLKAHDVPGPLEEFKELVAGLKKLFDKIDNVVCAIILCGYFNKPFEPVWDDHKQEIDAAVREETLTDEAEPNDDDHTVRSIHSKLSALKALLEKDNNALEAAYEAEYGAVPREVRKPQFWLKHFGVTVPKA